LNVYHIGIAGGRERELGALEGNIPKNPKLRQISLFSAPTPAGGAELRATLLASVVPPVAYLEI